EDDRDLAVDLRTCPQIGQYRRHGSAEDLLMELGHLACHGDLHIAGDLERVFERPYDSFGGLVDDGRVTERGHAAVEVAALAAAVRREAEKREGEGRNPAGHQGEHAGERTGDRFD